MIRYVSEKQTTLPGFETPFEVALDLDNRWVKLAEIIPWDELAMAYYSTLNSNHGRPAKDARMVIGAVIIKHKLCLSDEETIEQVRENPYLQYFVGLRKFQTEAIFVPSLFVEIRKRMGVDVFDAFQQSIIDAVEAKKSSQPKKPKTELTTKLSEQEVPDEVPDKALDKVPDKVPDKAPDEVLDEAPDKESNEEHATHSLKENLPKKEVTHQGQIILDATVAEQAIRFPTDLSLLNEAREISEKIIDELYPQTTLQKKPRTYRKVARKDYLAIVKRRKPGKKLYKKGNKQQLQYLKRNFQHIETMLDSLPGKAIPMSSNRLKQYWIIQTLVTQQELMYQTKTNRCDDRIVSISQPHVRPIIRGKLNKSVEFGAKLNVSLNADKIACVDELRWDAFNESQDLKSQVESYKTRHGYYPEKVLVDPLYGTRENRAYLKSKGIHYAGKPLGRPKKVTEENKEQLKLEKQQRHQDYVQRIPIEGKFGQAKSAYGLNKIKAKRADTSCAWINSIFLVMNLLILTKVFYLPKEMCRLFGYCVQYCLQFSCKTQAKGLYCDYHYRNKGMP